MSSRELIDHPSRRVAGTFRRAAMAMAVAVSTLAISTTAASAAVQTPILVVATPTLLHRSATPTLHIEGFHLNDVVSVSAGAGVTVGTIVHLSDFALNVPLSVAPDAAFGTRDLVVSSGASYTSTAAKALRIVPTDGEFHPLTPSRVLDTRSGIGGRTGALAGGEYFDLMVQGVGGVPASGVTSVVLNVTVTQPTGYGYISVFPTGAATPLASNLNFTPGVTRPNLVTVKVGTGGRVRLLNSGGSSHLLADVAGWYGDATTASGLRFVPLSPLRIFDSRTYNQPVTSSGVENTVGDPTILPTGAAALNVTVIGPSANGFATVYPSNVSRPLASNLNFVVGQTVANMVIVPLSNLNRFRTYVSSGSAHVVVDVVGVFVDSVGTASAFTSAAPVRFLDTRDGTGGQGTTPVPTGGRVNLKVAGVNGVPAGATAVLANLTVVAPSGPGYLTTWPFGQDRPVSSSLNFTPGLTIANLVAVPVGLDGKISIFNSNGSSHILVDVVGWFG